MDTIVPMWTQVIEVFMSIGARLKEERTRLKMNQDEFGQACGVRRRAISTYENGGRTPDAGMLENAYKVGVDVTYVITGKRQNECTPQCEELDIDVLEGTLASLYLAELNTTSHWQKLSSKKQAKIVAMLYRAFKASGKIDLSMTEDAIKLAIE